MTNQGAWTSRVVRARDMSADAIEQWAGFCDGDNTHPFFAFAFTRAVDRVHPHAFVGIIERDGVSVGFLPFQFAGALRWSLRAAERIGGNLSDHCGIIAGSDLDLTPMALLGLLRLNSFAFDNLSGAQRRHGLSGEKSDYGQCVPLSGEPEAFWANFRQMNREFGSQIDRKERRFARELGTLKITFANPDHERELPRIIAIKREQYRRTGVKDALASPWTTRLFWELLGHPDPRCTAVLSTFYAGDTWLASHLGLMSRDVFHYWFPVYNTEWSQLSPGHILTKHMMLEALSRGIKSFDLGGFGDYKNRFRPEPYELGSGFWQAHNIGGHLSHIVQSISWRIDRLKRAGLSVSD